MRSDYFQLMSQVARPPRHLISGKPGLQLRLERPAPMPPVLPPLEIIDFSRAGCGLRSKMPLPQRERVTLFMSVSETELSMQLPATVRWSGRDRQWGYSIGLQFDEEISLEMLGEMFLQGFLSMDGTNDE